MKKTLIIGGTSDLGLALAHQYANLYHDSQLILAGRNLDQLSAVQKDIEIRYDANAALLHLDLADRSSISFFLEQLNKEEIQICIFVIGYLGNEETARNSVEEMENIIKYNFTSAAFILNNIALQMLKKNIGGTIVAVSSVAGERGRQSNYHYGSAKAALTTYLSGMRNYFLPHGIHIMTVLPGFMQTKMINHLNTPHLLTSLPAKAAAQIVSSAKKRKNVIYVSPVWFWIMLVIKLLPESLFKKLKL